FPQASFFGGPIRPWWGGKPPRWLERHFDKLAFVYAARDFGPEVRPLGADEVPFGANMGFRTEGMRQYPFDAALGPHGARLLRGEEVDLFSRLHQAGHQGVWVGTSPVKHHLPAQRLTGEYIYEFFKQIGHGQVRAEPETSYPALWGAPRWVVRKYLQTRAVQ